MIVERTLVLVKPDGVQRSLIGDVISRLERKGLRIVGLKMLVLARQLAEEHYRDHRGKSFFGELVTFITSGPVVAVAVEGTNAVSAVRRLVGLLDPVEATPGSVRGDLVLDRSMNVIHGSDSLTNAEREIQLFFDEKDLVSYRRGIDSWISS